MWAWRQAALGRAAVGSRTSGGSICPGTPTPPRSLQRAERSARDVKGNRATSLENAMNAALSIRSLPAPVIARSAEIQGQIVSVAAGWRGTVQRVLVAENQAVRAGDVLVEMCAARQDARLPRSLEAAWTAFLKEPEVRSPVEGRVVQVDVQTQEAVGQSQPVAAILQGDDVWIVAEFHRDDLERLRPGQRASIVASGLEFT